MNTTIFETLKGKKLGEADGNLLQIPAKFNIHDASGAEVIKIDEKPIALRTQFTFYDPAGVELGKITKKLVKLIGEEYWVEKNGVEFMRIYGDFTRHDYKMVVNGAPVVTVHRKWISIRDQLGISITGDVDHSLVLGAVVVIEHIEVVERQKANARALAAYRQVKHELDVNSRNAR